MTTRVLIVSSNCSLYGNSATFNTHSHVEGGVHLMRLANVLSDGSFGNHAFTKGNRDRDF